MNIFKKLDPLVGSIVNWVALGGIVLSGFYFLLGLVSPFFSGLHWSEMVFLAVLMSIATLVALALVGALFTLAYRRMWPLPVSATDNAVAEELERTKERLKRAEERLDGAIVAPAVGRAEGRSVPRKIRLPEPERPRVSSTLLATLDWLERDFEWFISPIRRMQTWPEILRTEGPKGVMDTAELARTRVREMPPKFGQAFKELLPDLELVGINPISIKTKALPLGDILHSFGSIAYAMKPDEPNQAAFQLTSNTFGRAFSEFQDEIDRVKGQIKETRQKMAQGDL